MEPLKKLAFRSASTPKLALITGVTIWALERPANRSTKRVSGTVFFIRLGISTDTVRNFSIEKQY
jgi:hypothetical protein